MTKNNDQFNKIFNKNKNPVQKNNIESLLNRSIKFRKSRYVDQKLELFKQKFTPINGETDVVYSSSAYNKNEDNNNMLDKIDVNGFESPSKVLFSSDKLNFGWLNIHPIGPGLKDLGQLSSLNAVLQTLTYTPVLANYCMERRHSSNCASQEHCFACAVEDHIRTALQGQTYTLQPRVFAGKIKQMRNATTKDVYNVWKYFFDQIQSSLILEKGSKDKLVQQTTALCQVFGGYIQNKVRCPACNKLDNKYDFMMDLSLDLLQCSSLERCLTKHFKEQVSMKTECSSCQHEGEFKGEKSIYRPPKVLAIQLKRFNSTDSSKISKYIKFEQVLDIKRTVTESEVNHVKLKYELYAVIVHTGESLHNGHYVSYVKSSNGIWYCMDNENVQQVSVNRLLAEKASMLFYHIVPDPVKREKKEPVKVNVKSVEEKNEVEIKQEKEIEAEDEGEIMYIKHESDNEEENERAEQLKIALEEASKKETVENKAAIVVSHDENMRSKRDKLQNLIEKENEQSKSSQVKEVLLAKISDNQFQDNIGTWDDDIGTTVEPQRKVLLKKLKSKRKKVDSYDLEYDTGKVKKVKKKQEDNSGYGSYEEFKTDLQKIPFYETLKEDAYVDSSDQVLEENCDTPIYEFMTLRKERHVQLYTVNIQWDSLQVHYSLLEALKEDKGRPLHRLFVNSGREMLLEARDNVNSILVLFFNTKTVPFEDDTETVIITADIAVVHPLGKFHHFENNPETGRFEGWIKVRIARTDTIKRVVSKNLRI
ncbi:hypothetical protein G6F46_007697 [Rhizopus delemar]|uniref:ubiquitinyl hydrolase 1 n=1 Tax=Rhizopus delemar TaxID=936053 RepID=A0A9P7CMQ5_9FUNG|nr:hypothetical protein G6F54_005421 [Rhizopus delemar]KAG1511552.1 hypothetical protein G6F53_005860 [Rhizopus delemar]KAG1524176.1 hypothetical protein G6F52_004410 [Rhizopus delemar]KAG1553507.1 hypothetical protein G6F49_008340 [Rhizopus delemar]KAG1568022.1 hypothetical protein G6F50_007675 [Rhizopus delemar]